jgi:6-phosphogluconolactonase (cycloisomerase 2 family)
MAKGALSTNPVSTYTLPAGCAPYGVAASPDSKNVYVVTSGSTAATAGVIQLAVSSADGSLGQIGTQPLLAATSNGPRHAVVSPDGKHVYVTVTGYDKLSYFVRSATDGSLSGLTSYTSGVSYPTYVAISADGAHVYLVNNNSGGASGNVQVYSRNASTGALTLLQTIALVGAFGVAATKDGKAVYVSTTASGGQVVAYTRDGNSASGTYGQLTAVASGAYATASGFPNAVGISDDSAFVYVLSDAGSQYTSCYARNAADNTLTHASTWYPTVAAADANGNWDIALSADTGNTSLYSAISDGQRIAQFTRNTSTGVLTSNAAAPSVFTSNYNGTARGSNGPYGLAVLPNNAYLYAASSAAANTVDVFTIDQGAVADSTPPTFTGTIAATSTGSTTETLDWSSTTHTDNVGITSYDYSPDGTNWTNTGSTATSVGLTGLAPSTQYTYQVRAKDAAGNVSTPALSVTFTTAAGADSVAPVMQGSLSLSNIGKTGATVSWSAATDNVAVTGYKVDSGTGAYVDVGNVLTTNVTGRAELSSSAIRVVAYDAAGNVSTPLTATLNTIGASYTFDTMSNGSGGYWANQAVVWNWWPGGRIGSLAGITPKQGTGTTNASGVLTLSGNLPTGAGLALVAKQNTGATDDAVFYQAGTAN